MTITQTDIGGGFWLDAPAADAYLRTVADGCPPDVTSAGRTPAEQADLYARYQRDLTTGRTPPRKASAPGSYWDRHTKGLALDLPEPARSWMRANGSEYGWIADLVPAEPWHFEYNAALDQHMEDDMGLTPEQADQLGKTFWMVNRIREADLPGLRERLDKIEAAPVATGQVIDYAKLAKAVNDDAAQRMQG